MGARRTVLRSTRAAAAMLALVLVVVVVPAAEPAAATTAIPTQWVAQQHTEILGRAPSTSEFSAWVSYYATNQCTVTTLKAKSVELLTGATFTDNYPEGAAGSAERRSRVLVLIRAVFHREPTASDWSTYFTNGYGKASSPWTWATTIDNIFADDEFDDASTGTWRSACSTTQPNYGFEHDTYALTAVYEGTSRTQAQLQATLDATKPAQCTAGTPIVNVTLNPREVVRIGGSGAPGQALHIWPCQKLTTSGTWTGGVGQYASFGRLVPNGPNAQIFNVYWPYRTGLVRLDPGAQMSRVWVDGKGVDTSVSPKLSLVESLGSSTATPSSVTFSRVSEPPVGGTAIRLNGYSTTGVPCAGAGVVQVLVTAYAAVPGHASSHTTGRMGERQAVDGIAVHCEDATIWVNHLVDVSGNALVVYGGWNRATNSSVVQQSDVVNNTVLSAGVSGYSAYGADPVGECLGAPGPGQLSPPVSCIEKDSLTYTGDGTTHSWVEDDAERADFAGTTVRDNIFYNGGRTHFDVGIHVGMGAHWGDNGRSGKNASFTNNTSTPGTVANVGIAVSKMYDTTLTGNATSYALADVIGDTSGALDGCGETAVALDDGHASLAAGSQPATPVALFGCLIEHAPEGGMENIRVDPANPDQFAGATSGRRFYPWGGNWGPTTMFEDWSSTSIATAVHDLKVARQVGLNVQRLFVQLPEILDPPDATHPYGTPNTTNLARLGQIIDVAAKLGVYIDLTGLAGPQGGDCPDQDVGTSGYQNTDPACWYDVVTSEDDRWGAQAVFYENVALTLKDKPALLAYSLMNEPIDLQHPTYNCLAGDHPSLWYYGGPGCGVSGGDYFLQALTKPEWMAGRTAVEIRRDWIVRMTDAIRDPVTGAGDTSHLVTYGQLPHILGDAPGGGNDPRAVDALLPTANKLDYISVHMYPSTTAGSLSAALAAGQPTTSLPTSRLEFPLAAGTQVVLRHVDPQQVEHTQTVTLAAAASEDATSVSVLSFSPNHSYPQGATVACGGQGTSCSDQAIAEAVGDTLTYKVDGTAGTSRKPLVVEEHYPLSALPEEMDKFIQDAHVGATVRGWIGQMGGGYSFAQVRAYMDWNPIAFLSIGHLRTHMRLAPYLSPCTACRP